MGVATDADGATCFAVRNPHNKMKAGKGEVLPLPPHRGKSIPASQLYHGKATAEFLLPLRDADVLRGEKSSIVSLTMP